MVTFYGNTSPGPRVSIAPSRFCKTISREVLDSNYCSSASVVNKYFKYKIPWNLQKISEGLCSGESVAFRTLRSPLPVTWQWANDSFSGRDSLSRETGVAAIGGMPARKRQSMSRLSPRLALLLLPTPVHSVMLGPHRSLGPCFFQLISSLLKYQAEKVVQTTHRVYEFS